MTEAIEAAVVQAFSTEDEPMVRAVRDRMAGRNFWDMRPLLLPQDSAAVQARRVMDALIAGEAAGAGDIQHVAE
jgi:vanillate O-demethylase monooxygenase subunit